MSLNCIIKHIKERLFNEQGAGTVEYVIVVLVAIVIGSGLLAFGNQISGQVTKTGNSISSWICTPSCLLWSISRLSARPASRIDTSAIRMAMRFSCGVQARL